MTAVPLLDQPQTHPAWCDRTHCTAADLGPHMSRPVSLSSADDDVELHVRTLLWPAEPGGLPALPSVQLELVQTAFNVEPVTVAVSPDDVEVLASALVAAADVGRRAVGSGAPGVRL
jgi:hypothetical protein